MLQITGLDEAALPALQQLRASQQAPWPVADLRIEFFNPIRQRGRNVRIVWRDRVPVGCLGWVESVVATQGDFFISPMVAADELAAATLLHDTVQYARELGAQRIRVGAAPGEEAKMAALERIGFIPSLQWISLARPVVACAAPDFAALGLRRVETAAIDWSMLARLHNHTFRDVPHAAMQSAESMRADWLELDQDASSVLADQDGELAAFCLLQSDGTVDAIGIEPHWRRQGVADALYQWAQSRLALRQIAQMTTIVANTNFVSERFHLRAGFVENKPRATAYLLTLTVAG